MNEMKSNGVLIIPSLNPEPKFIAIAKEMAEHFSDIIVINDGSTAETAVYFDQIKDALQEKVHILTHEKNMGKGVALKTAFQYYKDSGLIEKYVGVVTADSDGQHEFLDVKMIDGKLGERHEKALHLGHRDLNSPIMPPRSKTGNKFTANLFNILYGIRLKDTQTGLRAMSNDLIDWLLTIKGNKFEYEMRMLVLSKNVGATIYEHPITTKYEVVHTSHYHTVRDSIRVGKVLFGSLFRFILAALIAAGVDLGMFYLFDYVVFKHLDMEVALLWATILSRTISSIVNFLTNRFLTFGGKKISKKSILKYYLLWLAQMATSYGAVLVLTYAFKGGELIIKLIVDLLLSILSYQIQMRWVFKKKETKTKKA